MQEIRESEKIRIYHHEIHKKNIKQSSILKLQTEDELLEGHSACANYMEGLVGELLLQPHNRDPVCESILLEEVEKVFTVNDNSFLSLTPTKQEIKDTIDNSNLHAAPGTDGIPSFLYQQCWDTLGDILNDMVQEVFRGNPPTKSQQTSLMVFCGKPKKPNSIKPSDKRRISLLNSDFKILTGLEGRRLKKLSTHTLSNNQLVAGDNRRIHHGINKARDAISAASKMQSGCGIADTDFMQAFDWMCLRWIWAVLEAKGMDNSVISRYINLYKDNISICVMNNTLGSIFPNIRLSLRQGDCPSLTFFAYGIDPLILFLEKRLRGIPIYSLPVLGPVSEMAPALEPVVEKYTVIGYADDLKPSITCLEEFKLVDEASSLFERCSGCKLHRSPTSGKCKFLPLAGWKDSLTQDQIPLDYMVLSDKLEMVGVDLFSSHQVTRQVDG